MFKVGLWQLLQPFFNRRSEKFKEKVAIIIAEVPPVTGGYTSAWLYDQAWFFLRGH